MRLRRDDGGYVALGYRIDRSLEGGGWCITPEYRGYSGERTRRAEQAVDYHGARWPRLRDAREVLSAIWSTEQGLLRAFNAQEAKR